MPDCVTVGLSVGVSTYSAVDGVSRSKTPQRLIAFDSIRIGTLLLITAVRLAMHTLPVEHHSRIGPPPTCAPATAKDLSLRSFTCEIFANGAIVQFLGDFIVHIASQLWIVFIWIGHYCPTPPQGHSSDPDVHTALGRTSLCGLA